MVPCLPYSGTRGMCCAATSQQKRQKGANVEARTLQQQSVEAKPHQPEPCQCKAVGVKLSQSPGAPAPQQSCCCTQHNLAHVQLQHTRTKKTALSSTQCTASAAHEHNGNGSRGVPRSRCGTTHEHNVCDDVPTSRGTIHQPRKTSKPCNSATGNPADTPEVEH